DLHVLDVRARQLAAGNVEKTAQLLQVALADLARLRVDLPLVLHAQEARRIVERKIELLAIEEVEEEHVVPAAAQHLQRRHAALGRVEQIAQHDDQSTPPRLLRGEIQGSGEIRRPAAGGRVQAPQYLLDVRARSAEREEAADSRRETLGAARLRVPRDDEPDLVALPREQVRQR